jgi:FOG: WD40 repeat
MSYKEDTWMLNSIDIGTDGSFFAVGGVDNPVRLRSTMTGALVREISGATWSECLAFSPDGALLLNGRNQANAQIIRVSDGTIMSTLTGFRDKVSSVAFNGAGSLIATGSFDYSVEVWNVNGSLVSSYQGNSNYVSTVALNPDGSMIASGGYDPNIRIWRVIDGTLVRTLPGHSGGTTICRFTPDGRYFASGGYDSRIRIYKVGGEWQIN